MNKTHALKKAVLSRISEIVDKLFQHKTLFQEQLEKDEVIKNFYILLDKISLEEILSLADEELTKRVERVMVREAVAGTLNDLTPEEIEIFDAAVAGR